METNEIPNENRKIVDDDDFVENIITSITRIINERAIGLQTSINELKDSVFVHFELKYVKKTKWLKPSAEST